jgi:hypothetical protein
MPILKRFHRLCRGKAPNQIGNRSPPFVLLVPCPESFGLGFVGGNVYRIQGENDLFLSLYENLIDALEFLLEGLAQML